MGTKRHTSRTERAEELRLMHAAGDDAWWGRPDTRTVNAVWTLVAPTLPAKLRHLVTDFMAKQVLTVALARCIEIGEEGQPGDARSRAERRRRRTFSKNHLFDAVAPKWSRTFKRIAEQGQPGLVPTPNISAFSRVDAVEVRRQLLALGVRLKDTWEIIVAGGWSNSDRSKCPGTNPFFYLTRPIPKLGYRVQLRHTGTLVALRRLLPSAANHSAGRLLLDSDPWPARVDRYQIVAERPFNGVEEDETVIRLLETMERTRLQFHARRFTEDYLRWKRVAKKIAEWKARVPYVRRGPFLRRAKLARRLKIRLDAYRQVMLDVHQLAGGQPDNVPDTVLIKTRVFRDQEGRFHARHFWPQHVSGKLNQFSRTNLGVSRSSQRSRWFSDRHGRPLAGYDVSSSQTQILAVLLGLTDLEQLTRTPGFKIYAYLAEQAIARQLPLRPPTSAAELAPVMKDLWVRILYGGHLREIVRDHDVLVPGTFKKKFIGRKFTKPYKVAIKRAEQNLRDFLEGISWYGKPGGGKLSDFLRASEEIARTAMAKDPYAGVTFTDPLAGTLIRWNPPRRGRWRLNCSGFQVALKLPGGWAGKKGTRKRRFDYAVPHPETGDFPVSLSKLKQAVAPGVIHLLDAMFSGLVVVGLADATHIDDCIALHDHWAVPIIDMPDPDEMPTYQKALEVVIKAAGGPWLKQLGGVCVQMLHCLEGTEFGPWMRQLYIDWDKRVREERWPEFRVEPVIGAMPLALEEALKHRQLANVSHRGEEGAGATQPPIFL